MGAWNSLYTRDVLDEAVRGLALSRGPLRDRVLEASARLTSLLAGWDFAEPEDSELFERIALTAITLRDVDGLSAKDRDAADAAAKAAAEAILDLRDTIMGRAIREARRESPASDREAKRTS
jgi:hypothetical protein